MPGGGVSGMTDHPLTETDAAEMWDEHHVPASPILRWALAHESERKATLALLRAAFDAGREHERTNTEDPRPWEPLNEGDPLNVGDEVRQELNGVTTAAFVGRVDGDGDPWTAEGVLIGQLYIGTWYVRRAVQELPTQGGTVLIPADGREYIEMEVEGQTHYAREALLANGRWNAIWRTDTRERVRYSAHPEEITPGTWKVDER